MRIFGRKANSQPTTNDVPPELKPYFNGRSFWSRLGRIAPLVVAIVLAAGIIGGSLWLRDRRAQQAEQTQTSQQNQHQPATTHENTAQPPKITQKTPTITKEKSTTSPSPAPKTPELLNTGPGDAVFGIAAIASIIGTILFQAGLRYSAKRR